jgi:hypothetical protein
MEGSSVRTLREIGPIAIATGLVAILIWTLLDRGESLGTWLLAAVVLAHGWLHVLFLAPAPARATNASGPAWPFDLGRSWVIRRAGLDRATLRGLALVLVAIACGSAVLGALATLALVVPVEWWPALVILLAGSSALLLILVFSTTLLVGLAIDVALVWLVVGSGWRP